MLMRRIVSWITGLLLLLAIGAVGLVVVQATGLLGGARVYAGLPWNLTLVNDRYAVPEDWTVSLTDIRDNQQVDSRMYPALQAMFDACRADGLYPLVWSSYRTTADQQRIMDEKIDACKAQGMNTRSAKAEAKKWVAAPGYSEHQLGLSVDINSEDESLCSSWDVYAWLDAHCAEYGFILRYPADKTACTGIDYEPWHFRYVGETAAEEIMERGLCLEEYIEEKYG